MHTWGVVFTLGLVALQLVGVSLAQPTICRPEVLEAKSQYVQYHERDIVLNSVTGEYLLVWIEPNEAQGTSAVIMQKYDPSAAPVGNAVVLYSDDNYKTYISGAFNPTNGLFVIVFEYDGVGNNSNQDIAIFAVVASTLQTVFGVQSLVNGHDRYPIVVYNSIRNYFLLMYVHFTPTSPDSEHNIAIHTLNATGFPNTRFGVLQLDGEDRDPAIYYNSQRDEYMVLFASEYFNTSDIAQFILTGDATALLTDIWFIGQITLNGTTHLHDSQPQVTFSPTLNEYFMIWELDIFGEGTEPAETDVLGQVLDVTGQPVSDLFGLSLLPIPTAYRFRDATLDYDTRHSQYVFAFSYQEVNLITSDIGFATLHEVTFNGFYIDRLNSATRVDHVPDLRYSPTLGEIFISWASGNYSHVTPPNTKRSQMHQEFTKDMLINHGKTRAPMQKLTSPEIEYHTVDTIAPMEFAPINDDAGVIQKRQQTNGNIRTAKVCLPLSSTTGASTGATTGATTGASTGATTGAGRVTSAPGTSGTTAPVTTGRTSDTTQTSASIVTSGERSSPGTDGGIIALAIIIPLVVIIIIIVAIALFLRHRKKQKEKETRLQSAAAELSEKEREYG